MKCYASNFGGAVFFSAKGSAVAKRLCGYNCTAGSDRQFLFFNVSKDIESFNDFNDSIVVFSQQDESKRRYSPVYIIGGNMKVSRDNITNNVIFWNAGIRLDPILVNKKESCLLSYSSISNNTAFGSRIIFSGTSGLFRIESCNIILCQKALITKE